MKIDLCLCNQGDLCKSEGGMFPPFFSSLLQFDSKLPHADMQSANSPVHLHLDHIFVTFLINDCKFLYASWGIMLNVI